MDERARSMRGRARSYLLVPAGGEGEGLGHLLRCVRLSARLGAGVSFFVRHLDDAAKVVLAQRVALLPARSRPAMLSRLPRGSRWDVVAVDARGISAEELGELMPHGLVVGLDEGGDARGFAPFLVDTLPGPPRRAVANLSDPSYLFLPPQKRRQPPRSIRRILLSLGGEDREHLGEKLAEVMIRDGVADAGQLTVVQGPLSGSRTWPSGVAMGVATGPDGISPLLSSHDVLITHFGMAAFEALATGIPAILFNPTAYHAELGQAAGFPQIGVGTPDTARLKKLLADPAGLYQQPRSFNRAIGRDRGKRLPELLRTLSLIGSSDCPVCGAAGNRVIGRFPDRTYRVCRGCGITYLESYAGRRREYSDRYFLADYKAQYGRTYLEDFSSIKAACEPRVSILLELLGERGAAGTVVDVGCAYGPFLAALKDRGSAGFGLDVSASAVAHVKESLGLPAVRAEFEMVPRGRLPRRISAVTMWYVIEHFTGTREALARAAGLLEPGGVLAFSTPNGRGISGRSDRGRFLAASPGDHFIILSPRGLRKILASHHLRLRRIRVTGHHPERFPGLLGAAARRWTPAARALRLISELCRLGDTFEAYAVKTAVKESS